MAGSNVVKYVTDRDLVFLGATATLKQTPLAATSPFVVIGTDPLVTNYAAWFNDSSPFAGVGLLWAVGPVVYGQVPVRIPVRRGETIYVAFQLGGFVIMYFDEMPAD